MSDQRDRLAEAIHNATPPEEDGGVPDVCNRWPEHEAMADRLLAAGVTVGLDVPALLAENERLRAEFEEFQHGLLRNLTAVAEEIKARLP